MSTQAQKRVTKQIARYLENPVSNPERAEAVRSNVKKMATRAQIAAARRNIKKAQAARRRLTANPRRRRRSYADLLENRRRRRRRAELLENRRRPRRRRRREELLENRRRRRRARRPARRRRLMANPTPTTIVLDNPWYRQPRRHAKAARKGWRRRRRGAGKRRRTRRRRGRGRCPSPSRAAQCLARSRRRDELLDNPMDLGLDMNPIYENQVSPFSIRGIMNFGTAAAGVGLGLLGADFLDRYIATRMPTDGVQPWYGRDAVAAQKRRPDGIRLVGQAGTAFGGLVLAYFTRRIRVLPWLLGGVAVGSGANLLKMLADWWVMPAVLPVKDASEASFANRMYPLEQPAVQDIVSSMFEKYKSIPTLAMAQTSAGAGINSPLGDTTGSAGPVYALGKGNNGEGSNPAFLATGRQGLCPHCQGVNGCFANCPTLCPNCPEYQPLKKCQYKVQSGDDLESLASSARVGVGDVTSMNSGTPDIYWKPGNVVTLPYGMCMALHGRPESQGSKAGATQSRLNLSNLGKDSEES